MTMAQTVFESLDEVRAAVGRTLGTSDWIDVTQEQVELFAEATSDHGWIHVDAERPTNESPFGDPPGPERPRGGAATSADHRRVAHAYLMLSLTNLVLPQLVEVRGASLGVNYGTGKVRFPAPAPVGRRVRGTAELVACDEISGGVQTTIVITMEVEGGAEPACVVESLSRWLA
jgi:acyl dehydratase